MDAPIKYERPCMDSFILDRADNFYIIYSEKTFEGYCTCCHKQVLLHDVIGHNIKSYCPNCGQSVTLKNKRYGRKNLEERGRILWFKKIEEKTFAQLDNYYISYQSIKPIVTYYPIAQYVLSKKKRIYYRYEYGWKSSNHIKLPAEQGGFYSHYAKNLIFDNYLTEIGTDLKYANLDMSRLESFENAYADVLIRYIANFLRYQSIELLEKAGFTNTVSNKLAGIGSRNINWRAKSLEKILKMKPGEIKKFKPYESIKNLDLYNELKKEGYEVEFSQLHYFKYGWQETMKFITEYIDYKKALKYLDTQKDMSLIIYRDYLSECKSLHMDMKDKTVLRPKDLAEAHSRTSQRIADNKNKIIKEKFIKTQREIFDVGSYEFNDLIMFAAKIPEELDKESEALKHCVRTYKEKVADGRCAILFIRHKNNPNTPFYTLELDPKQNIVQCRGYKNQSMTDELKEFIEHFKTDILKNSKKGKAA